MTILKVDTVSGIGTEGTVLDGDTTFDSLNYMTLPKGTTTQSGQSSSGISSVTGAIRYNTDSNKMECFTGTDWWEIAVSPTINTSQRGLSAGGHIPGATPASPSPVTVKRIEYINMTNEGTGVYFGDLTATRYCRNGAGGSITRGIFFGGYSSTPSAAYLNTIDYVTIATTGDAIDFGDTTTTTQHGTALSNNTRGLYAGGHLTSSPYPTSNHIGYVTIASTGNTTDFGDMYAARFSVASAASQTRGLYAGGSAQYFPNQADDNVIQYLTIASTGNTVDFGDLNTKMHWCQGASSNTRAVWVGGYVAPGTSDYMQMTIIATLGNANDFGDLWTGAHNGGVMSNQINGFLMGGEPVRQTRIQKFALNGSTATAVPFGDLSTGIAYNACTSNTHGGL